MICSDEWTSLRNMAHRGARSRLAAMYDTPPQRAMARFWSRP
jgi:hypothetical protein